MLGLKKPGQVSRLAAPEIFEARWRQLGVANGMLDVSVPKIILN